MARLVLGIAFLTLAAAVVASTRKNTKDLPAEPNGRSPAPPSRPRLYPAAMPSYYAQFSLN